MSVDTSSRQGLLIAAVALALPIVSPACSDGTGNAEGRLDGDWRTGLEGLALTSEADGSWTVAEGGDREPFDTDTYASDAATLRVGTKAGAEGCQAGQTGTDEVIFVDDDTVELARVDDECGARSSGFSSGLTRADETAAARWRRQRSRIRHGGASELGGESLRQRSCAPSS